MGRTAVHCAGEMYLHPDALRNLLDAVAAGTLSPTDAAKRLETLPFESLEHATLDHHRALRCGFPEVIFGLGKTPAQIAAIFDRLAAHGGNVLATRVAPEAAKLVKRRHRAAVHEPLARTITLRQRPSTAAADDPFVAIVCAGTADTPVAEEARVTCEIMDRRTETFYDVGVAGIHRLLSRVERLRDAAAIVVVAGMEGALPSVVGGLVAAPVIAVPTSVGYGASFGGLAALLTMLNSCASGVSVVNIDNGFGAGYQAARIADPARTRPAGARDQAAAPPRRGKTPRAPRRRA